jgi:hypothetical protein
MRRTTKTIGIVVFISASLFGLRIALADKDQYVLKGEALDESNQGLDDVLVRIYRKDQKVGEDRTKNGGKYTVSYTSGDTISTIRYDFTGFNPATISDVSGKRDHTISKVLHPVGSNLARGELVEAFSSLQAVYFIDKAGGAKTADVKLAYGHAVWVTSEHAPTELRKTSMVLKELYELNSDPYPHPEAPKPQM